MRLTKDYKENLRLLAEALGSGVSFDIIERRIGVGENECAMFFVDGFAKDAELQRVMQEMMKMKGLESIDKVYHSLTYVEVRRLSDVSHIVTAVLSGETALVGDVFGDECIIIDARTYPARGIGEPNADRVIEGARDGFVETLIMNTALVRRRIRDPRLTVEHMSVGTESKTDVAVLYMRGVASPKLVTDIKRRLGEIKPRSLPLGYRSLAESLIRDGWWNPFPKIRTTERPDTAAAQITEGAVLIITDTSPQVMILPTSIFDYLQETNDYYLPPIAGSYLRLLRLVILLLSLFVTPLWYLALENAAALPPYLAFLVPDEPGALPIILQLLLVEVAIDGLKIASMNTPDMLASSLSVIGALILGEFAVGVGWVSEDVILYMAFVALAGFAQQNVELGYAIKLVRVVTLIFVFGFGVWGLLLGVALFVFLVASNKSVYGKYHYLYPLIPFDPTAMKRLIFRVKKHDFEK